MKKIITLVVAVLLSGSVALAATPATKVDAKASKPVQAQTSSVKKVKKEVKKSKKVEAVKPEATKTTK